MRTAFEMPAAIDAVDPMVISLKAVAAEHLSDATLAGFEVALSEALVNVVEHGYASPPGATARNAVGIEMQADDRGVTIVISDTGRAAPGDLFATVESFDAIDAMAENGRGLPLIEHFADMVDYRSEGGVNRLTLVFGREGSA